MVLNQFLTNINWYDILTTSNDIEFIWSQFNDVLETDGVKNVITLWLSLLPGKSLSLFRMVILVVFINM